MYYDPTKMKVFDKNSWVLFDVVEGKPCFRMYNFVLLTKKKKKNKDIFRKRTKPGVFCWLCVNMTS